jgi:hypothetical protein
VQFVMTALIVNLVGVHAWYDGAITLAFPRTFAESGLITLSCWTASGWPAMARNIQTSQALTRSRAQVQDANYPSMPT